MIAIKTDVMKATRFMALVLSFAIAPQFADAKSMSQLCTGVMLKNEYGTHLALDSSGAHFPGVSWCDASFEGELEARALATCPLGSTCKVDGLFQGHGVFAWTKIKFIKRLK